MSCLNPLQLAQRNRERGLYRRLLLQVATVIGDSNESELNGSIIAILGGLFLEEHVEDSHLFLGKFDLEVADLFYLHLQPSAFDYSLIGFCEDVLDAEHA